MFQNTAQFSLHENKTNRNLHQIPPQTRDFQNITNHKGWNYISITGKDLWKATQLTSITKLACVQMSASETVYVLFLSVQLFVVSSSFFLFQ